jgi:hypothetical protein
MSVIKTQQILQTVSVTAGEDLEYKNRFVTPAGIYPGSVGAVVLGVLQEKIYEGSQAPIATYGIAIVEAGDAITAGQPVVTDADGKAIAATDFSATTPTGAVAVLSSGAQPEMALAGSVLPETIIGYALDTAAEDGDLIRVKLI